jgi:hypothetical protein
MFESAKTRCGNRFHFGTWPELGHIGLTHG